MASLNRWLARFSYTLLICAGLLGYAAWGHVKRDGWSPKPAIQTLGALVSAGLGLAGIRARHSTVISAENHDVVR